MSIDWQAIATAWGQPLAVVDGENIRMGSDSIGRVAVQLTGNGTAHVDLIVPTGEGPFYGFEELAEDWPLDDLAELAPIVKRATV